MWYDWSGNIYFSILIILFMLFYGFIYSDFFEDTGLDEDDWRSLRRYLRFCIFLYCIRFFYRSYYFYWYFGDLSLHMFWPFAIVYYLQIKFKIAHPDNAIILMHAYLLLYLIIYAWTHLESFYV